MLFWCLLTGRIHDGAPTARAACRQLAVHLSVDELESVCATGMLTSSSKDDAVDNVLVEFILALELCYLKIITLIVPVYDDTWIYYYDTVQADILNNTNKPDASTNSKMIEYMKKLTLTVSAADESWIMAMKVSDVYLRYCKFQTLVGGLTGMRTLVKGWCFDWKLWIGVAFKILVEAEKWSSCSKTRVSTSASDSGSSSRLSYRCQDRKKRAW
jgi:hypothetical protein